MSDLNSCSFTGNLGKDAVIKTIGAKGTVCAEFSIANNTGYGNYAKTNWVEVQLWGQRASSLQLYLTKGTRVAVTGKYEQNNWVDQNGVKHSQWRLTASDIVLLSSAKGSDPEPEPQQDYGDDFVAF